MQVTRATDYAVRIMLELASLPPGDKVQLNELIQKTGVRGSFLSKVVQRLVHAGMVSSHRGTRGGFSLRVPGEEITLLDVIEAIEGPTQMNLCLGNGPGCERKSWCGVHPVWQKAQSAYVQVLAGESIAHLAMESKANLAKQQAAANRP
ncbi:MAG TPA: Rrf2 family transcriptional regulator [Terracidiphilus sp.]|nr:Rrf2 family transcriptional regulator [Terracidiphilus sp.]